MTLKKLKGLGPKSEKLLNEVGIHTRQELAALGAVSVFIRLERECSIKPSLNFLYAMVGALEDRHWIDIAKTEKSRLLIELDGGREFDRIFKDS